MHNKCKQLPKSKDISLLYIYKCVLISAITGTINLVIELIDYKAIGRRIKTCRKNAGLTQVDLAEKLGVTDKYISQIECGTSEVSLKRIFKLAELLEIKPEYLISDINPGSGDYLKSEISEQLNKLTSKKTEFFIELIDLISRYE